MVRYLASNAKRHFEKMTIDDIPATATDNNDDDENDIDNDDDVDVVTININLTNPCPTCCKNFCKVSYRDLKNVATDKKKSVTTTTAATATRRTTSITGNDDDDDDDDGDIVIDASTLSAAGATAAATMNTSIENLELVIPELSGYFNGGDPQRIVGVRIFVNPNPIYR